jgi:hypothetical protein
LKSPPAAASLRPLLFYSIKNVEGFKIAGPGLFELTAFMRARSLTKKKVLENQNPSIFTE